MHGTRTGELLKLKPVNASGVAGGAQNQACSPSAEAQSRAMLGETQKPILPHPRSAEYMQARKEANSYQLDSGAYRRHRLPLNWGRTMFLTGTMT
jgi:hypothetical protein